MNAGRELDARIHTDVMDIVWDETRCRICGWPLAPYPEAGCIVRSCSTRPAPRQRADAIPAYSTDISAAWMVVDKLHEGRHKGFARVVTVHDFWPGYAECEIVSEPEGGSQPREHWPSVFVSGSTPAHAICLAALEVLA